MGSGAGCNLLVTAAKMQTFSSLICRNLKLTTVSGTAVRKHVPAAVLYLATRLGSHSTKLPVFLAGPVPLETEVQLYHLTSRRHFPAAYGGNTGLNQLREKLLFQGWVVDRGSHSMPEGEGSKSLDSGILFWVWGGGSVQQM